MRVIPCHEKKKRGCQYCADVGRVNNFTGSRFGCPYDECPYHELDNHDSYEEFLASGDSRILIDEFFQTVPSCYELQHETSSIKNVFKGAGSELNF